MTKKIPLEELLPTVKGKKILFLGREGIFTDKEIERFLKKIKISFSREYDRDVAALIEYHRLNPLEENISNEAYNEGIPLYKLAEFEKLLSEQINDDELLMGIKLSNNQERIFRILGNEHISDELFVKLLKMYTFHEEEEESREDRDVITYTLRRYIDIKPNEEDLLYSHLTLRRLASEADDPELLTALMGFPDFEFLVRGKEKVTLRETIARNPAVTEEVVRKLLSFRDNAVNRALAGNGSVLIEVLKELFIKNNEKVDMALAANLSIDDELFAAILEKGGEALSLLLIHQPIGKKRLEQVERAELGTALFALLGANEALEDEVAFKLLAEDEPLLLETLSGNKTILPEILEAIYKKGQNSYAIHLARNPSTPVWILQRLYETHEKDEKILAALAYNPAVPITILQELFAKEKFEINRGLATNVSLPMDLLDILKLDTRLQNDLAQNENLAQSFEQILKQNKVMLNI